jgi:DNA-binding beta-propeller fold protein YncE
MHQRFLVALLAVVLAGVLIPAVAGAQTYNYLYKWGTLGAADGQFNSPQGVAVDGSGHVYVADTGNNRIQKFTSSGGFVTKWGTVGPGNGQFSNPAGVAVDDSGNVYVADTNNNRIQKFTSSGGFVTKWGTLGSGNGQFNAPMGVAVDASGNVYVADAWCYRIQRFTSSGGYLTQWGRRGSGDGQFSFPRGVAVDTSGNVYVADWENRRIQKFTSDGAYVTQWGPPGAGRTLGVAVDTSGNVYVMDSDYNRIQKFTGAGIFVTAWGDSGSGNGQFFGPSAVAVVGGRAYVVDRFNHRIQVFTVPCTTPGTPSPSTPACGTMYPVGTTQVVTECTAASNATSYDWELYSGATCSGTAIQSGASTWPSLSWSNLSAGNYAWRVRAINDGNPESESSPFLVGNIHGSYHEVMRPFAFESVAA